MSDLTDTPSIIRQRWIEDAVITLRKRFKAVGYSVPEKVRVSIGWPRGSHGKGRAIGQCWGNEASSDEHSEIFVSPELGKGAELGGIKIIGVLAHELAHAILGTKVGHKAPFKRCAEAVGLTGKMTATSEGPEFVAFAESFIKERGEYPAGSLNESLRLKKQSTRLIKCECTECGYTVRVTKKWIESAGTPLCPVEMEAMEVA